MPAVDWLFDRVQQFVHWVFSDPVAVGTVAAAIISLLLLRQTMALRKIETEPDIAVFLDMDSQPFFLIKLVIKNIGKGPAYEVRFEPSMNPILHGTTKLLDLPLITEGLSYIPPGQDFRMFLGAYMHLPKERFNFTVTYLSKDMYRSKQKGGYPTPYQETYSLWVDQFKDVLLGVEEPLPQIVKHLEAISKHLERMKDHRGRLRVHISGIRPISPTRRLMDNTRYGEIAHPTWINRIVARIEELFRAFD